MQSGACVTRTTCKVVHVVRALLTYLEKYIYMRNTTANFYQQPFFFLAIGFLLVVVELNRTSQQCESWTSP